MAVKLNHSAVENAKRLIKAGEVERGDTWNWKEHQPTPDEIDKFLNTHTTHEYGLWFLGIDTEFPENNADRYVLPYGDLKIVHKNALASSKKEAANNGYKEIEATIDTLLAMIQNTQ